MNQYRTWKELKSLNDHHLRILNARPIVLSYHPFPFDEIRSKKKKGRKNLRGFESNSIDLKLVEKAFALTNPSIPSPKRPIFSRRTETQKSHEEAKLSTNNIVFV